MTELTLPNDDMAVFVISWIPYIRVTNSSTQEKIWVDLGKRGEFMAMSIYFTFDSQSPLPLVFFVCLFLLIYLFYFTTLYWFCHTLTWICHGCTCVPHPDPPSQLPSHPIPLGHPSAPAPSILYHASNLDWRFISHMIIYMFQYHPPMSSRPRPLPQVTKDCSIYLCFSCCLAYRVIFTIFLNSIYMR